MAAKAICSVPECGKLVKHRGWCSAHYQRWRNHGSPIGGRTVEGEPSRYLCEVIMAYDGDDCLKWPFCTTAKGIGQIWHDGRMQTVARVVCEMVNGPPPTPKHHAAHSCGKGHEGCITKGHLSWKTPTENQADRLIHGTDGRGERCRTSKLTEGDVRQVRASQELQADIATQFGISVATVSMIKSRKRWNWLE